MFTIVSWEQSFPQLETTPWSDLPNTEKPFHCLDDGAPKGKGMNPSAVRFIHALGSFFIKPGVC